MSFKQLFSGRRDTVYFKQMTLFVPKEDRDFIEAIRIFLKLKFPDKNFNWFVILCIKHTVNSMLNPEMFKLLREIYYDIAGEEVPPKPDIIQLFRERKNGKAKKESDSQDIPG